ncbi:uncharacterized protein LOC129322799 [Prosopis cineraria]|uniref:uncharacterized protein LOC129322799 n=1 Tax=Prosopis cineraria TaxID=364024 RepID=UPI00240ED345|nr:uncharacterized protein LOC129322799 [Prosopis cineraria]
MAQLLRPLIRHWPWRGSESPMPNRSCGLSLHYVLLNSPCFLEPANPTSFTHFSLATLVSSSNRNLHFRPCGLRLSSDPMVRDGSNSDESSIDVKKSRNQLKREAKRAVRWGMELASLSAPQIKRILRLVTVDREVFEALMLVKRLRPDVREGRRRQFNYIGKLLREVQPELMDKLIEAAKDGNHTELQKLCVSDTEVLEGDDDFTEFESEEDDEESDCYSARAVRWFDGLVNKDIKITNEVYSLQEVEFDRQELRRLVRRVHSAQEQQAANEAERKVAAAKIRAEKALTRFLLSIAKQIPNEY